MTKYNWDKIDKEWNWVAMDASGMIYGYTHKPTSSSGEWTLSDGEYYLLASTPVILNNDGWKDSLEERPKPTPRYRLNAPRWEDSWITDVVANHDMTLGEVVHMLNEIDEIRRMS